MVNLRTTVIAGMIGLISGVAHAADPSIIVQSTTSTANSGLYDYLLPSFKKKSGITVNVVAVGTGQAIKNARNCDGDVLLVHAKPAEEAFVKDGYGVKRTDLMYNDFVIVGPKADPAGINGMKDVTSALKKITEAAAPFASRGRQMVSRNRFRHGGNPECRRRHGSLCDDRPGDLDQLQEQG